MSADPVLTGRKIYERHLDLLLAEELSCHPAFARYLFDHAFGTNLPAGEPGEVTVTVSHWDDDADDPRAAGENDLLVEAQWPTGETYRLLVEDKLDAVLQPAQVERYLARARRHAAVEGISGAAAMIVGPDAYLEGKRRDLKGTAAVSIEEIAGWLNHAAASSPAAIAARLRWRSRHLIVFDEGKRLPAPEMPAMIAARDHIVGRLTELHAPTVAGSGMRTAGSGWLNFDSHPALVFKVVHGVVDIYLDTVWPESPEAVAEHHRTGAGPDGFEPARDSGNNPLLRCVVRPPSASERMRPITEVAESELNEGADACARAAAWLNTIGAISA